MEDDAADPSLGHYNDGNRAFLQALLARGTMTFEEGQKVLAAIFTVQDGIYLNPFPIYSSPFKYIF